MFGVNILQVKEINNQLRYTTVPDSAFFIKGLFNLRGQIITIFDLAKRLGREDTKIQEKTRNLILKTDTETSLMRDKFNLEEIGNDAVGFIIDRIGDVVEINEEDIQQAPANVGDISKEFIKGVVELKNDLLIILNVEEIIKF
jgi:purine-binding chemotaxis protein CheW